MRVWTHKAVESCRVEGAGNYLISLNVSLYHSRPVKEIVALPALEHVSDPWDIGSASGELRARSGTGTFKHIHVAAQFFSVAALV
jgi:hypothetical protein